MLSTVHARNFREPPNPLAPSKGHGSPLISSIFSFNYFHLRMCSSPTIIGLLIPTVHTELQCMWLWLPTFIWRTTRKIYKYNSGWAINVFLNRFKLFSNTFMADCFDTNNSCKCINDQIFLRIVHVIPFWQFENTPSIPWIENNNFEIIKKMFVKWQCPLGYWFMQICWKTNKHHPRPLENYHELDFILNDVCHFVKDIDNDVFT